MAKMTNLGVTINNPVEIELANNELSIGIQRSDHGMLAFHIDAGSMDCASIALSRDEARNLRDWLNRELEHDV